MADTNEIILYQRSENGPWYYDFYVSRRRHRGSCRTADRGLAEARARAVYDAAFAAAAPAAGGGEGLRAELATLAGLDGARARAEGVTAKQLRSVTDCWRHVVRHLGPTRSPALVTYDDVEAYVAARRAEKARGQSIRKEVQALRRGLVIARRRGWIRDVPELPKVRRDPKRASHAGKLVDRELLLKWLAALEADPRAIGAADQARLVLLTGLRKEEARRLCWSWVLPAFPGMAVAALLKLPEEGTKTREERVIGLVPEAFRLIQAAHIRHGDAPLFPGDHTGAFQTAARRLGLSGLTLRDLRHTHATWAAYGTGDAVAAQAALGHSDLATTQIYLSSTLNRTAGAAVAVEAMLSGHSGRSQSQAGRPKVRLVSGRGEWIRTTDFLLPKDVQSFIDHARTCTTCASRLLDELSRLVENAGCGHSCGHSRSVG